MKKLFFALIVSFALLGCKSGSEPTVGSFSVRDADGQTVSLSQYEGQVLLIVNTATKCGFTPQYTELESIYEKFADKGFTVLDFPCNQFGGQAPGTIAEIREFCSGTYNVSFPQFDKIDVNGQNADPLFVWLYGQKAFAGFGEGQRAVLMDKLLSAQNPAYASNPDIKWNFTKFLIDRKGRVVARFEPTADMAEVSKAVEALL
ncbi:MAG: glutathione peroxidase [Bacteroidales bacterium]|nr:glutathione peroxidase [Bacteroidales bacterium]